ncbi:hypothetical protein ZWY2020_059451 [Hordeum vulgare]|nr:hypothetical protein ZWY2020_059451 [Hordeum vulgare]
MSSVTYLIILVLSSLLTCSLLGATALRGDASTDFQALRCLKLHLNTSAGVLASWKIDDSLQGFCTWPGLTCSKRHKSRVVALDLESFHLDGQIPPCIANLSLLTRIHLPDNQLWGPIPAELGQLNRLRYLNLSSNNLSGMIPSNLSSCSQLRVIDLGSNSIVGEIPTNLSQCSNMQQLNLGHNKLTGGIPQGLGMLQEPFSFMLLGNTLTGNIPVSLGSSSSLHSVYLTKNSLTGPIPYLLFNSSSLQFLVLANNKLGGEIPPALFNSTSLQVLSLAVNNFTGSIPSVFPNIIDSPLKYLILTSNNLAGTIPSTLGNFSSLSWLLLGQNSFQGSIPVSIGKLPNLQVLDLSYNFLSKSVPASIYNISTLTYLAMGANILAGEIPYNIGYNLPKLQTLDIGMNKFHGQIPTSLANTSNLEKLNLAKNSFHGINRLAAGDWSFLTSLTNCTQLVQLFLDANILQGHLPSTIGSLSKSLEVLLLRENKISGTIPQAIERLTNIQILYMEKNWLTGGIPESIGNLQNLFVLSLSQNKLSGQIPLSIGNLSQLTLGDCEKLSILNLSCNSFDDRDTKGAFTLSSLAEEIPLEIGHLLNLGPLNIANNQLSGQIPSTLGECVHLESLHMEGNNFHGRIPQSFMNLRGIIVMDLSQNNLSGKIPNFFESFSVHTRNKKLCASTPVLGLPLCSIVISRKKSYTSKILKIVAITAISLVMLSCFGVIVLKKRKKIKHASHPSIKELKKLTYADLVKATNGFCSANLVGTGKYGFVYKGRIESEEHHTVAIKVFKLDQLGATKSFLAECEAMRNTRHRNLVRVVTVCSTTDPIGNEFKALVLEFMRNGDLESWLYPTLLHEHHPKRQLCLGSRITIAVDIAAALDYLHNHCMPPMAHCDLKPSNVLLDDVMGACVGDFGLAKFLHGYYTSSGIDGSTSLVGPRGSVGYIAPEYGLGSKISMEGDVYSYGIIILEMLTGKRPTDEMFKDGLSLYKFMLDPKIIPYYGNQDEEAGSTLDQENYQMAEGTTICIHKLAKVGLLCAAEMPKDRPGMQDVYAQVAAIKEAFSAWQG